MKKMNESAQIIQHRWKKRLAQKKIMIRVVNELQIRYESAHRWFVLVDDFLDSHVHDLIDLYNKRARALHMISFEEFQVLNAYIDD